MNLKYLFIHAVIGIMITVWLIILARYAGVPVHLAAVVNGVGWLVREWIFDNPKKTLFRKWTLQKQLEWIVPTLCGLIVTAAL